MIKVRMSQKKVVKTYSDESVQNYISALDNALKTDLISKTETDEKGLQYI